MVSRFDINLVERARAVMVVVRGELDLSTAPLLEEHLVMLSEGSHRRVVVDLDRVAFIDSTGLQVLIGYMVGSLQGRMLVTRGSPQVQMLFELSGVEDHLEFWDPE
jgi:anti-sigma B factor antagonist